MTARIDISVDMSMTLTPEDLMLESGDINAQQIKRDMTFQGISNYLNDLDCWQGARVHISVYDDETAHRSYLDWTPYP